MLVLVRGYSYSTAASSANRFVLRHFYYVSPGLDVNSYVDVRCQREHVGAESEQVGFAGDVPLSVSDRRLAVLILEPRYENDFL